VVLLIFSLSSVERANAIMARVESQKTAISFRKPVQIKAIYVNAGQHVTKGQLLLEVSRPDLQLDQSRLTNDKQLAVSDKNRLLSDYQSKVKLLDIEMTGKLQRLQSEIERLQTEIDFKQALYADMIAIAQSDTISADQPVADPDLILLNSYQQEKLSLAAHFRSEMSRLKMLLDEDLRSLELRIDLLDEEMQVLKLEQATLQQFAPFDGTIGNVNAQLMELVPPYQTIVSVYEQRPSIIKAHVNLDSGYELLVGQQVTVESADRDYSTTGEVLEVGARIVPYEDPSLPTSVIQLYGKEVFINLPDNNLFLYGELVYVYAPTD
jgi:multidrug efflux pump subunit AcrA (membrane-fusion protein)